MTTTGRTGGSEPASNNVLAQLKDWQILRQCRHRGDAINYALHIIAGLWNLKTHKPLRVSS